MNLEKILNSWVLIAINLGIIVVVELTGSLFLETGLIHIIALLFLLLGISRIFVHYYAFDQYLQPFIVGSVAALLLFSVSHLYEYFNFGTGAQFYSDSLYVDVTNMYMTAMLMVGVGAQYFLSKKDSSWWQLWIMTAAALFAGAATAIGLFMQDVVSIEPDEPWVYLYALGVVGVTVLCTNRLSKLGRSVSIIKGFATYIVVAFVLIAGAALHYLLYDLLKDLGLPLMQITYISHFLFYAALSFMFLAFPRIARLGGMYLGSK